MPHAKNILRRTVLLSATGLLAACGGGGGGGDGGGNVGIAAGPPVTVTASNAGQVAGASIGASDGLTGNSDGLLGILPAAVGSRPTTDVNIIETVIRQVKNAPQYGTSRVTPAAVQNRNENCDSGSLSLTFNDADNDFSLSTGDTVSMTANSCVLSGVAMNGSISMNNIMVTGDQFSPPYSLQFNLQTSGFSVSAGGETVGMNGGGTIFESTDDDVSFTSSFSGNGIEITAGGETLTLTDYLIAETENQATGAYTVDITATISSSTLGGSVRVTTDVPLSGVGNFEPDAGQLTCAGDNSSVTLTVIDSINIQLEVDLDGDGLADSTINEAWTTI